MKDIIYSCLRIVFLCVAIVLIAIGVHTSNYIAIGMGGAIIGVYDIITIDTQN